MEFVYVIVLFNVFEFIDFVVRIKIVYCVLDELFYWRNDWGRKRVWVF